MLSAAVLCPHPPLLLRELGGLQDPVSDLRAAAVQALRAATSGATHVVVVGGHDEPGRHDVGLPTDVRRFGTTSARPSGPTLPATLGIGARLLHEAGWAGPVELVAAAWDADGDAVDALGADLAGRPDGTVLLVLGDGSTRRGEKAPGYLDERSFGFDDLVARALADGDAAALRDLDVALAAELMVLGSTALRVLGAVALQHPAPLEPQLTYRDDPFGVSYFVATWRFDR